MCANDGSGCDVTSVVPEPQDEWAEELWLRLLSAENPDEWDPLLDEYLWLDLAEEAGEGPESPSSADERVPH